MMLSPRIAAGAFVFVLILLLAFACISPLNVLNAGNATQASNGSQLEHAAGNVTAIEPDLSFVLRTASGQQLHFACAGQCRQLLNHLQRHLNERAHTDVYYQEIGQKGLLALDID